MTPLEALPFDEAAVFVGLSPRRFRKAVASGLAPQPALIGDLERWPTDALERMRWGADPGCSLYFIGTNGSDFIKVGITTNIGRRCDSLQVGSPFELVPILQLPGSRKLETRFHRALWDDRVRGEWFRVGPWFDEVTAWGPQPERDTVFAWLKGRRA